MAAESDEQEQQHRRWLVEAEHTASRDFDRNVVILSGGALGLSITFVREFVPVPVECSWPWIALSWTLLTLSLLAILVSMLTSQHALRQAVREIDEETAHDVKRPGGSFATVTGYLNVASAIALVLGLVCLVVFALMNYGRGV